MRAALVAVLLAASSAALADFSGTVVRIVDGDTLDVLVQNRPVRVRLAQIDAPERRQAYGTRARQALSAMVFRRVVTVSDAGADHYGRRLGTVFVAGMNINAAMVDRGMAWAYRQYLRDRSLIGLEQQARAERRGLWNDPAPVTPWFFRAHPFP
ncbi:nuclease (SNase-like) [Thiobacillus denitrificans ATCC 25259]|uniref:Nuclease (SNase-like) n=1 Tax=Thiobacillus denitrificans (strain ATCC 25259 / T1) TaxID=292415 RepID=Q3SI93_THIDA|nr:thermonuclease family protein [Thiobacillus denitrificans]AAZ97635.1 nuclease (SNase-like) [Thiobacillus denitrificans ATCC 25259]